MDGQGRAGGADPGGRGAQLRVRPMEAADAPAVVRIYAEGIAERVATFETESPSPDRVAGWARGGPAVVVERDGIVVAWARATAYRPERGVYAGVGEFSVYVAGSARRGGVGRAALGGLVEACRAAGFWKLVSRVFPENTASLALCRAAGFREVGVYRRHGRLEGRWRDCVIVERLIDEPDPVQVPGPDPLPGRHPGPGPGADPGPDPGAGRMPELWRRSLREQALAIEAAVTRAPDPRLQAEVAGCPGYTVAEVVRHLGAVYRLVTPWMQQGRRPRERESRPADGDVRRWFADGWRALEAELAAAAVGAPTATWNPADTTRAFWWRRMAHETAVHAFDVLAALGGAWRVDAELAADGVDEALRLWLGTRLGAQVGGDGSAVRVRAGARAWTVGLHPYIVEVHEGVRSGGADVVADATVAGEPVAVYLWVWGRAADVRGARATPGVEVAGDAAAARLLRATLARAMV